MGKKCRSLSLQISAYLIPGIENLNILFVHEVQYSTKPVFEMHEFPELLALRGHNVGFLDYLEDSSSSNTKPRVHPEAQIDFYHVPRRFPGVLGRLLAAASARVDVRRAIISHKPDVIVLLAVPTLGWHTISEAKRVNIPVVYRALDISHKIRKTVFWRLVRLAEQYVYSKASWVSANNQALLDYCNRVGGRPPSLGSVDLPPLNISHFERTGPYNPAEKENIAIYMGSFFYFSGLPEFISGIKNLPRLNFRLLVAGSGEQEEKLRNLVTELELDSVVEFMGFIPFAELPRFFSQAKVAINPMLPGLVSNKAFPNKVIQYMAAGIPVVSSALEGLSSIFTDEDLKLAPQTSDLPRLVSEIVEDNLRLTAFSVTAADKISSIFRQTLAVEAFERTLEKVVHNGA
jgi:glycosyltransferase involved in cell wall biosynthesis